MRTRGMSMETSPMIGWQFRVQHDGYTESPNLGADYAVADSNVLQNTAPNHDPPILTTG